MATNCAWLVAIHLILPRAQQLARSAVTSARPSGRCETRFMARRRGVDPVASTFSATSTRGSCNNQA
eukprot:scaffold28276_cov19-Prasinocladus_malaysianus.AAC.1